LSLVDTFHSVSCISTLVPNEISHNKIVLRAGKLQKEQAFYKPALFVDEIGLTSDKYIFLNETTSELPLHISIGPMSPQVSSLCFSTTSSLFDFLLLVAMLSNGG
jgi:hypothetical protein